MTAAEFLRIYPLRAPNLMWFLGAGASASTGIPTAGDMIWDFKRRFFCAEQRVSIRACEDIGDPLLRSKLQAYLNSRGDCPPLNTDEEYSHYFSTVFPNESDRRRYIDEMLNSSTPSYGFMALAVLLKLNLAKVVWTTNFDRNVEDSSATIFGTTKRLVVGSLETPHLLREAMQEGRWPILAKLHGDFQSRRLKNTSDELRTQDAQMRRSLIDACKQYGLIVSGYSGRDNSVMEALDEAIDGGAGYPSGLFWISRSSTPSPKVAGLIEKAKKAGVDAHIVTVQTFDEFLADIVNQIPNLPQTEVDLLNRQAKRFSEAPLPTERGGWPVVRLNAVEIIQFPAVCRLVECKIGGMSEVRDAIKAANAAIVATRKKAGVLYFGADAEAKKAFEHFGIERLDLYSIETRRLRYDSAEQGLMYNVLVQALRRERGLLADRRGGKPILHVDPNEVDKPLYAPLMNAVRAICGTIPGTATQWAEAIAIGLSYRLDRLWLVIEPTIWTSKPSAEHVLIVRDFQRERQAARYNRHWNSLLEAWCTVLTQGDDVCILKAYGIQEGADAVFHVSGTTAFSRRLYRR